MVQICAPCNEKHVNLAESGTVAVSSTGSGGNGSGGRYTPSDNKSQANSESSNVRFKVSRKPKTVKMILSSVPAAILSY